MKKKEPKLKLVHPPELLPRMAVVEAARKYIGNPWVFGGRNRCSGLDCIGLLVLIAEDLEISHLMGDYDWSEYPPLDFPPHGHPNSMDKRLEKPMIRIPFEDVGIGDVETYWIRDRGATCHCAIISDKGFIHTHQGCKQVMETVKSPFWNRRRTGAFRYPNIEDGA